MVRTGHSAQQCLPFLRTKVDLMLCQKAKRYPAISRLVLKTPSVFASTTCPGKLFHTLTTRCLKKFFLISIRNFSLANFHLCRLVLLTKLTLKCCKTGENWPKLGPAQRGLCSHRLYDLTFAHQNK